jgi:hypothetical protein
VSQQHELQSRAHSVLIITEGEDEQGLVVALLKHLKLPDCDVINAEGMTKLKDRTAAAVKTPGPHIDALAIVRDAELDAVRTAQSTRDILNHVGFAAPPLAFQVQSCAKGTCGYAILPDGVRAGSIEDICLESANEPAAQKCVEAFFNCLAKSGVARHTSDAVKKKAHVQAYLAGRATDRVVHRAGLGFRRGCYDLDSKCLSPMREFLQVLLQQNP